MQYGYYGKEDNFLIDDQCQKTVRLLRDRQTHTDTHTDTQTHTQTDRQTKNKAVKGKNRNRLVDSQLDRH